MLKQLLTELRHVIDTLDNAGYFEDTKPAPEQSKTIVKRNTSWPQEKGRKLTREEVLEIFKEDRLTHKEIAEYFGVSDATVAHIKNGNTWWKVTGLPRRKRKPRTDRSSP